MRPGLASVFAVDCALGLASVLALVAAGCRTPAPAPTPAPPETGRFPHATHSELPCVECHAMADVLAGRPAVPGADDHAPCDRGACHQDAFLTAPGPLCVLCHKRVDPVGAGGAPLEPYPPVSGSRSLASQFSHAQHLNFSAMERQVGFHVSCGDCHLRDDNGSPTLPGHAVCGRCHAPEAALPGIPSMSACDECHRPRTQRPQRRRRFIVGDLHFRHGNHQSDRRGERIPCATCHVGSAEATVVGAHPTPTTAPCVDCHDDLNRTPSTMRMRVCQTCHADRALTFGALAPRSHLPARERPEDHTLAFQRDHAADARRWPRRCARCHTFMSGGVRDVCDECHQVMPPRDHAVTWREYDHGPAAATRADRCSVCHVASSCTACHQQTPRSHFPLAEFKASGHISAARFRPRACIVCHRPDEMVCAECHTTAAQQGLRRR